MSDCCDVCCWCCLCTAGIFGAWCNTSPSGGAGCCRSRPRDVEENDAFHEQLQDQYDPEHNPIYNVNRSVEPRSGHRRVQSQPTGHASMLDMPMRVGRSLGGDSPFTARPPPDQLPRYPGRTSTTQSQPQPHTSRPPATLQPGSHRRGESHPPRAPVPTHGRALSSYGVGSPPIGEAPVGGI